MARREGRRRRRDLGEARAAAVLRLVARLAVADLGLGRLVALFFLFLVLGLLRPALVSIQLLIDVRGQRRFGTAEEDEAEEAAHAAPYDGPVASARPSTIKRPCQAFVGQPLCGRVPVGPSVLLVSSYEH